MVRFPIRFASVWLSLTPLAQAAVCNWQGGDSVWSTPANWSCAAQPGTSDQAVLASNNNLTLDVAASVQSFTLNSDNAVLLGTQSLTSINTFDLQAGTVNAILAGTAGAHKTTTGTVTLNGANTYTGATTITEGTLALGANDVLANDSTVVVNGGELAMNGFSDIVQGVSLQNGSISGGGNLTSTTAFDLRDGTVDTVLAGSAGANKTTSGTVILSRANTYTGATTITEGTLALGANDVLANDSTVVVNNGGELAMNGFSDIVQGVSLQNGSISGGGNLTSTTAFDLRDGTVDTVLAGSAGANKTTSGTVTLNRANTYTGATTITEGTLALGANDVLANNSTVVVNGGELAMNGFSDIVQGVSLQNGSISGGGSLTSTTAFDLRDGTVDTVLAGSAGANKTTSGTVILSRANTYTGATTITEGTLALGANDVLANDSTLVVNNGGELAMNGFSDIVQGVSLQNGSISGGGSLTSTTAFDLRDGTVDAVLAGSAGLIKSTAGTVFSTGANTYTGLTQIDDGILNFSGSRVHVGTFTGNGTLEFSGGTQQFNAGATLAARNLLLSGGTNNVNTGSAITSQSVTLSGGINTLAIAITPTTFTVSGGDNTVGSTGAITANSAVFSGGNTEIIGDFDIAQTTTISGNAMVDFAAPVGATLNLGHTLTISDNGQVNFEAINTRVDHFIQTGGILSGPAELRILSSATLSGGAMQGPGRLIIEGGSGSSTDLLLSGDFRLDNTSTLINSGNVWVQSNAAFSGGGVYRQTTGATRVDGNWSQSLTEIQSGVLTGTGTIGGVLVNNGTVGAGGSNLVLNGPVSGAGNYAGRVTFKDRLSPGSGANGEGIANINAPAADLVLSSSSTLAIEFGGDNSGNLISDAISARTIDIQGAALELKRLASQPSFTPRNFLTQTSLLSASNGISGNFNQDVDCPQGSNDLYVLSKQTNQFLLTIVPKLSGVVPADVQSLASALQQADCNPNTPASLQTLLDGLKPFLVDGTNDAGKVEQFVNALRQISPKQLATEQMLTGQVAKLQLTNVTQRLDGQRYAMVGGAAPPGNGVSLNVGSPPPSAGSTAPTTTAAPATGTPSTDRTATPSQSPGSGALSFNVQADGGDLPDLLSSFSNLGLFINGQFEWVDRTATATQRGYSSALYGITAGADYRFNPRFLLGTTLGYGGTYAEISNEGGAQNVAGYTWSTFGSLNLTDQWYVDVVNSLTYNQYDSKRAVAYSDAEANPIRETAQSKTDGWQNRIGLTTGYDIPFGAWTVGLRARGEYGHMFIAGRREQGAGLGMNLIIDDQEYDSITSAFGTMVSHAYSAPFGVVVSQVIVEWERQWIDSLPAMRTGFVDTPDIKFTTASYNIDTDYINLRGAVSAQLPYGGSAFIQYDTTLGQELTSRHALNVGVRFEF